MHLWITALNLAVRSLLAYKSRSFLTMLGMIIGIASVIVMMSIGEGATAGVQAQFESMGSNLLMVFPGSSRAGGVRGGFGSRSTLTVADAQAIAREAPSVEAAAYLYMHGAQLVAGNRNWRTTLHGTTPPYQEIRSLSLHEGSFLTQTHLDTAASVVVLGSTVVDKLFLPGETVIGQTIRIQNIPFRIVGILATKGSAAGGRDQDDLAFVPYTTLMRRLISNRLPGLVHLIAVSARSRDLILEAKQEIETLLRQRHRILPHQEDDFSCRTLDEFAGRAEEANRTMVFFFVAVATISLVVGGIGIMNIMLVSVTERTREIGIRLAVGAREGDVLVQFLVEAIVISLAGGVVGTILGSGAARLISYLARWPTIITVESILLATLFSATVGIFFGFYPARKASRLDPIQALSYD
jgi:putative ABC transport system permease protein